MLRASHQSDSDRIRLLIDAGGDVNALQKNSPGNTPLQEMISWADIDIIRYIIIKGADIHKRSLNRGLLAVHFAAVIGRLDVLKLLHELGADVHALDYDKRSPLDHARYVYETTEFFKINPDNIHTLKIRETIDWLSNRK